MARGAEKNKLEQLSFADFERMAEEELKKSQEEVESKKSDTQNKKTQLPATSLMKTVARRSPGNRSLNAVFSEEERKEIFGSSPEEMKRREEIKQQKIAQKKEYLRIKKWVKEKEKDNRSKLYAFPSVGDDKGWYKMMDFSALYYAYRLADRMGRNARVMSDTDKGAKALQIVSLRNMEKFVEQFEVLEEGGTVEKTLDEVYIFTLKKPLSDEDLLALRRTEETRRAQMHNILWPKAADPAIYNEILMLMRQTVPRVRKLERMYYSTVGEKIISAVVELLSAYHAFTDKLYTKEEAGKRSLIAVNEIIGSLTILAETNVWGYDAIAMIGQTVAEIKRLLEADFNV